MFWRPEEANSQWSDEGCRLVTNETTKDVTTCECDHLTLFAVMVESSEGDVVKLMHVLATWDSMDCTMA